MSTSQEQRILNHFKKYKTLDRLRAFTKLNIFELSSRIRGLEKKGYRFDKKQCKGKNQFGERFHYKLYSLAPH